MHSDKTTNSFFFTLVWVVNIRASCQFSRINSEKRKTTNEWVCHNFKCKPCKWSVFTWSSLFNFACFRICSFNVVDVEWRWQIFYHSIQKHLNALVFVRRTAKNRNDNSVNCSFSKSFFKFVQRNFIAFKISFKQSIISFNDCFNQLVVQLLCFGFVFFRDFNDIDFCSHIVFINFGFHCQKVDNSWESISFADWHLNWKWICFQSISDWIYATIKVSSISIHLVYIDDCRNFILCRLTPNSFCLWLNLVTSRKNQNRTIKNLQRTFNFNCEVNVSRSVDDVDLVTFPETSCTSRSNCNTSFLFLSHPVHRSCTVVNFTDLVIFSGIEQNSFSCCCFTSINMGHNSDVSCHFKICSHIIFSLIKFVNFLSF